MLSVSDDGIGIAKEEQDQIFQRFYQADNSHSGSGTGLGLFIVKGLIEAMNGEIKLHSDKTCGFCVEITLNLSQITEAV